MGTRSYENFDLLIEAAGAGRYSARVTNCPVGDTPTSMFSLPFSPTELENLLLKLDPGRSGMRRIADRHTQASIDLGTGLFDAVFRDQVLVAWSRSKDAVRQEGQGLRLRLRLTGAPSLAAMPWELLYDKSSRMFYAQSDRTPVVRYLDVTNPPRPLRVRGPLRILVIVASPHDLPRLDVEREWATIHDALADKQRAHLVSVDRLRAPTMGELQKWLRHNEVHVLHFVGHGHFDDRLQDGVLMFTEPGGRATPISSTVLGTHIRDHDPLRLVVLNACQTARVDEADPYGGMAQGLIQQEAAAVVAMQFPISDDAAIVFTREFYGAVADGEPLDQAMASARKALLADHAPEWATPVLFLRAIDGRVFDRVDDPELHDPLRLRPLSPEPKTGQGPSVPAGIEQVPMAARVDADWPPPISQAPDRKPPSPESPKLSREGGTEGPRRRRRRYWIGAAAVVVIAAISAGFALERSHKVPELHATGNGQAPASPRGVASGQGKAALSYNTYSNQQYGFTALWPSSLAPQAALPHSSGQTWASRDGRVQFSAYGDNNPNGYSPQQDAVADSKGLSVTYSDIKGDIVTVSGYNNNGQTIVYRRDVVGSGAIDTIYWQYPTAERAQWNASVERTAQAFQPGDVATNQGKTVLSYNKYADPRYGFITLWPSSLRARSQPPFTDSGSTWVSADGQVLFSAYGDNNINGYSPQQDAAADSKGLSITYSDIKGDIVTVSGYNNNGQTIVYRRDVVGPGSIDGIYWQYPTAEGAQWNASVERTAQAFQPGDVTHFH